MTHDADSHERCSACGARLFSLGFLVDDDCVCGACWRAHARAARDEIPAEFLDRVQAQRPRAEHGADHGARSVRTA